MKLSPLDFAHDFLMKPKNDEEQFVTTGVSFFILSFFFFSVYNIVESNYAHLRKAVEVLGAVIVYGHDHLVSPFNYRQDSNSTHYY